MRHAAILGKTESGEMKLVHFGPASEVHRRYKSANVADKDLAGLSHVLLVPQVKVGRMRPLTQPARAQVAPPAPVAEASVPDEAAAPEETAPVVRRRRATH